MPFTGLTILIVDDEEALRDILAEDFRSLGANVIEAKNGATALVQIKSHKCDAIITDLRMPGGDGLSLLRKIQYLKLPIEPKFFLCSGTDQISQDDIRSLNISEVFEKPYNRRSLARTVARALGIADIDLTDF